MIWETMAQFKDIVPKILQQRATLWEWRCIQIGGGICKGCVSLAVFCTEVTFSILSQVKLIFVPMGTLMPKPYVQWKQDQGIFNKSPLLIDSPRFVLFNRENIGSLRITETFTIGWQSCFKSFFTVVGSIVFLKKIVPSPNPEFPWLELLCTECLYLLKSYSKTLTPCDGIRRVGILGGNIRLVPYVLVFCSRSVRSKFLMFIVHQVYILC